MKPFSISEPCRQLVESWPPPGALRQAAVRMKPEERKYIYRLWLSEGIPYAFKDAPALYDAVRNWLWQQLGVHPKAVTIIGSGRIGYSLAPPPEFGRKFGSSSDLDLVLVSANLFGELVAAFQQWQKDTETGRLVHAAAFSERTRRFWPENLRLLPGNIERGFVDAYKIPTTYLAPRRVEKAREDLQRKLWATNGVPRTRKVSIRVYRDWESLLLQMDFNFRYTLNRLADS